MSTTFGILKIDKKIELINGEMPFDKDGNSDWNEEDFIPVAFRSNTIYWINELGPFLPDNLKVYPLDNTAQGIYFISDIKKEINNG